MPLKVTNPGTLALLVDYGRQGYQHLGVSSGGPMDEYAFLWANRLLDNQFNAAQIEISYGPFFAEIQEPANFSITGADLSAKLNDQALAPWSTFSAQAGDVLSFYVARQGLRAYLAVQGGFSAKAILGSCTTVMREHLGGIEGEGNSLKKGDAVSYSRNSKPIPLRTPAPKYIPDYAQELKLGVILGYQDKYFSESSLKRFFNTEYQISAQFDRMGYRLSGEKLDCELSGILSEGISLGAIQVPPDGQPIVLLRDRQTIGGYPKLGVVNSLDTSLLAQKKVGDKVRFESVDLESSLKKRRAFNNFFGIREQSLL